MLDPKAPDVDGRIGILYGLAAFLFWGLSPAYFKLVAHVAPVEVLAHRILFSTPLLLGWLCLRRRLGDLWAVLRDRRTFGVLAITTVLIGFNWFVYTYAVIRDQVLQVSLGYYIYPLVSVALGYLVLGERLRRGQWLAVALAAFGVAFLAGSLGGLPALSLLLAGSFAAYSLLRKTMRADAIVGLTVETLLLWPWAFGALVIFAFRDSLSFAQESLKHDLLLAGSGVITVLPLLWFTHAVRRLPLTTIGLLQYLAPSFHLLLALSYGEPFTRIHAVAFGCIWTALILYTWDSWRGRSG